MITAMTAPKRTYLGPCSDIAAIPLTAGQANCTALRIPLSLAQCHVTLVTYDLSRKVVVRASHGRTPPSLNLRKQQIRSVPLSCARVVHLGSRRLGPTIRSRTRSKLLSSWRHIVPGIAVAVIAVIFALYIINSIK